MKRDKHIKMNAFLFPKT